MENYDENSGAGMNYSGEDVSFVTNPGERVRRLNGRFTAGDLVMGRYKVLAELGQGGMGVVYKCFDETAGIEIALKALPPELSHNTLEMEDIKDNFQLVHNLHHPNIASYNTLEKDSANGNYYLIMECVNGEDLRRWLKRRRKRGALTPEAVLPIIRQVAEALDYAHSQRVMHRDIKPGNIMVDMEGNVKVLDFGLAAQIHTSMTRVSMAYHGTSGTGPYMAPEQWKGGHNQGAASDQYALAVMTYEMLAGYLPFESSDVAILRESVLKDAPDPIENLSDKINDVLRKALGKNQSDRYPSCADFVSALAGETSAPGVPPEEEEKQEKNNTPTDENVKEEQSKESPGNHTFLKVLITLLLVFAGVFGIISYQDYLKEEAYKKERWRKQQEEQDKKYKAEQELKENTQKAKELYDNKQYQSAFEYAMKADLEDSGIQFCLGWMYANGNGTEKNYTEAVKWYRKSAEQGHKVAQNNLGYMYEIGNGVKQDYTEAVKWYRKSAEQGYERAQNKLKELEGKDVPVNMGKVVFNGTVMLPGNVQLEMVKVESGTFTMSKRDGENYSSEKEHRATLTKDFYIGKYEVTQAQWQAVMGNNPSNWKGDNLPVEEVSWHEAIEFCEKLNERGLAPEGWRFTLPTETQWEYAAVGRKKSHGFKYSGSNTIDGVGWYKDNSGNKTHPVGTKAANELGIYDMSGNVWEWCLDDYSGDSSKAIPEFRRSHDSSGADRVYRGGSWCVVAWFCRSAYRDGFEPGSRDSFLGFRLALTPGQ